MISEQDINDAVRFTKHPLYNWTDKEFDDIKALLVAQQERFDFKIVVAICTYNDEDFLYDTLKSCLNIVDLDGIHIMDGAWTDGGTSPRSTDNTKEIVTKFKRIHPDINVVYGENIDIWRTEGEKRNRQLKSIEDHWGKAYVLVLDADETIETNTGQTRHWMKHELEGRSPLIGVVKAYARGSKAGLPTPRLIPVGEKYSYHYHTERPMEIHNSICNVEMNYEWNDKTKHPCCFDFNNFRIINHWNARNQERLKDKQIYVEKAFKDTYEDCKWIK